MKFTFIALFFLFFGLMTQTSFAVTCPTDDTYSIVSGVCVPTDTGLSDATVADVLLTFMNWILGILGFFGILLFLGSLLYSLQKKLKEVKKSYKDGNCSVAFLGDGSIDYIEIDGEPRPDLVKLFNRGREDIQKEAAKKVVEEEGFSGLLKGLGGQ
jgi:hypothetical protein